jgi:hypothetical protein
MVSLLHVSRQTRFCYAAIAGVVGAQSVLFAKAVSSGLREGVGEFFTRYESYLLLAGLLITIYLQIRWLNEGLRMFDALYIVPVFQVGVMHMHAWYCQSLLACPLLPITHTLFLPSFVSFQGFWISFSVFSGMVVYEETKNMSWLSLGLFSIGIIVTLSGVYMLR